MASAVAAVAAVVGSVAGAVASAVAPVVATIGAVLAPAVAAIGSIVGTITAGLGAALAPIANTIGGIGSWILKSVGQSASGLIKLIGDTVRPMTDALGSAIRTITAGIDVATRPILEPIKAGLEIVKGAVDKIGQWVNTAFHPSARLAELKAAHPGLWEMSEGYTSTFLQLLQDDAIITATEASLLTLPDVIMTINQVATLKVLSDLVKGQASVSDLIGKVSEGSAFETAQAIAILSKSITESTVGILDRVDTDVTILRASIDKFDETMKRSLELYAAETKADILKQVTPKLDVLGKYQIETNRRIAAIVRHIDDRVWFAAMLARALP